MFSYTNSHIYSTCKSEIRSPGPRCALKYSKFEYKTAEKYDENGKENTH